MLSPTSFEHCSVIKTGMLTGWFIDWLTDWLTDRHHYWLTDWMINLLHVVGYVPSISVQNTDFILLPESLEYFIWFRPPGKWWWFSSGVPNHTHLEHSFIQHFHLHIHSIHHHANHIYWKTVILNDSSLFYISGWIIESLTFSKKYSINSKCDKNITVISRSYAQRL